MSANKPPFDGEWVRLGDVCKVVGGSTPKTDDPGNWGGDIKWVTPAEIRESVNLVTDTLKHVTPQGVRAARLRIMPAGTVLLTTRAPIGKVALAGDELCCNQGFKCLICSSEISNEWLLRLLRYKSCELQQMGTGATFRELSKKVVSSYRVKLPAMASQLLTVERLSSLEKLLGVLRRQLVLLDQLVKSRFVEMFGKVSDDGVIPLKECCSKIQGGKTPSMKHPEYYGGTVPFIKSGDVKGDVISSGSLWLSDVAMDGAGVKLVERGSVLVVVRSALLQRKMCSALCEVDVAINQDIKAFTPKDGYSGGYLLWAIRSHEQRLLAGVRSVSTSALDFDDLCNLPIMVATEKEQQEFATFVAEVDKSRFNLLKAYGSIIALFRVLFP